jgi:hypothetical protein
VVPELLAVFFLSFTLLDEMGTLSSLDKESTGGKGGTQAEFVAISLNNPSSLD